MLTSRSHSLFAVAAWLALTAALGGCSTLQTVLSVAKMGSPRADESVDAEPAQLPLEVAAEADEHRRRAHEYLAQGDNDAALEDFNAAVALDRGNADDWLHIARLNMARNDIPSAETAVDRALARDADLIDALLLKGRITQDAGRTAAALSWFLRALELDPESLEARLQTANVYLAQNEPDRAAPLLRGLAADERTCCDVKARTLWSLATAYEQMQRWPECAESYAAAIPLRKRNTPDDWQRLASALAHSSRLDEAQRVIETALAIDPRHAASRELLVLLKAQRPQGVRYAGRNAE